MFLQEEIASAAREGATREVIDEIKRNLLFDINCRTVFQSSLLHLAVKYRHHELATELIKYGADINALDYGGMRRSPLHWALHNGDVAMAELLLEAGADPDSWCSQDQLERELAGPAPQQSKFIEFKQAVRLLLLGIHHATAMTRQGQISGNLDLGTMSSSLSELSIKLKLPTARMDESSDVEGFGLVELPGDVVCEVIKPMAYPISAWL